MISLNASPAFTQHASFLDAEHEIIMGNIEAPSRVDHETTILSKFLTL